MTEKNKEKETKLTMEDNRFTLCHVGELVVHLELLYSNDTELGTEVRRLLNKNGNLDYKKK